MRLPVFFLPFPVLCANVRLQCVFFLLFLVLCECVRLPAVAVLFPVPCEYFLLRFFFVQLSCDLPVFVGLLLLLRLFLLRLAVFIAFIRIGTDFGGLGIAHRNKEKWKKIIFVKMLLFVFLKAGQIHVARKPAIRDNNSMGAVLPPSAGWRRTGGDSWSYMY